MLIFILIFLLYFEIGAERPPEEADDDIDHQSPAKKQKGNDIDIDEDSINGNSSSAESEDPPDPKGYCSPSDEDSDEEEFEDERKMSARDAPIDLSAVMDAISIDSPRKKKKGRTRKLVRSIAKQLQLQCPYLFYHWRDIRMNLRYTIEILMPCPLSEKNVVVKVYEQGNGSQILSVVFSAPTSWLSPHHYRSNHHIDDWNGSRKFEMRSDHINKLEEEYGQAPHATIKYEQRFSLPERVDNFEKLPSYEDTGPSFVQWSIISRTNPGNQEGTVDVLNIELVAEKKYEMTMKQRNTPQRRVLRGTFDDDWEQVAPQPQPQQNFAAGRGYYQQQNNNNQNARASRNPNDPMQHASSGNSNGGVSYGSQGGRGGGLGGNTRNVMNMFWGGQQQQQEEEETWDDATDDADGLSYN